LNRNAIPSGVRELGKVTDRRGGGAQVGGKNSHESELTGRRDRTSLTPGGQVGQRGKKRHGP